MSKAGPVLLFRVLAKYLFICMGSQFEFCTDKRRHTSGALTRLSRANVPTLVNLMWPPREKHPSSLNNPAETEASRLLRNDKSLQRETSRF